MKGTIHLRRRQIFAIFDPYPPLSAAIGIPTNPPNPQNYLKVQKQKKCHKCNIQKSLHLCTFALVEFQAVLVSLNLC